MNMILKPCKRAEILKHIKKYRSYYSHNTEIIGCLLSLYDGNLLECVEDDNSKYGIITAKKYDGEILDVRTKYLACVDSLTPEQIKDIQNQIRGRAGKSK